VRGLIKFVEHLSSPVRLLCAPETFDYLALSLDVFNNFLYYNVERNCYILYELMQNMKLFTNINNMNYSGALSGKELLDKERQNSQLKRGLKPDPPKSIHINITGEWFDQKVKLLPIKVIISAILLISQKLESAFIIKDDIEKNVQLSKDNRNSEEAVVGEHYREAHNFPTQAICSIECVYDMAGVISMGIFFIQGNIFIKHQDHCMVDTLNVKLFSINYFKCRAGKNPKEHKDK
jgi:hypothetical protein